MKSTVGGQPACGDKDELGLSGGLSGRSIGAHRMADWWMAAMPTLAHDNANDSHLQSCSGNCAAWSSRRIDRSRRSFRAAADAGAQDEARPGRPNRQRLSLHRRVGQA